MKHTYQVTGMTCSSCEAKVKSALLMVDNVTNVEVSKDENLATITMDKHIDINDLQKVLNGKYQISIPNSNTEKKIEKKECCSTHNHSKKINVSVNNQGKYYCPMHCEGEKVYDKAGDCPICGMNLEKIPTLNMVQTQYTCPMHPEIIKNEPGACPICGMDLIPLAPSENESQKTYRDLLKKMKIALAFTLPIFIIAMIEMLPNNPLLNIMSSKYWNWVQFFLSIPVVFYACWMFFARAWKSIITYNLNMFTLIGIGTGVAFLFSIMGLLFPSIFPSEFKTVHGTVSLYFEATTVILTLVLLGQLMEAKAHSQTSSACFVCN